MFPAVGDALMIVFRNVDVHQVDTPPVFVLLKRITRIESGSEFFQPVERHDSTIILFGATSRFLIDVQLIERLRRYAELDRLLNGWGNKSSPCIPPSLVVYKFAGSHRRRMR